MKVPAATYRLQLNRSFGYQKVKSVIPYLYELGISDIYASPIFKAAKGSKHGYDIVDPNQLNHELGNWDDFTEVMAEKRMYKMDWLQDIVPNHMAFNSENQMLMDIFEKGRQSRFFSFFDIIWDHPDKTLTGKIMVPVLGEFYDNALESGKIQLGLNSSGFHIRYYEYCLPLNLSSYSYILGQDIKQSANITNPTKSEFEDLAELCDGFDSLAQQPPTDSRDHQINKAKQKLWELYNINDKTKGHIENVFDFYNGKNNQINKYDPLDTLLNRQYFKLALWKRASERINYRRFFYLNDFIGLCVEKKEVFEFTHQLLLSLAQNGTFTGLRIDHIDGLYNPTKYLEYLREKLPNTYIIVEKILEKQENLPENWPIQGTTGYEFADCVNKLFCDKENEKAFSKIYLQFTGLNEYYKHLVYKKKKSLLQKFMAGEVKLIARLFERFIEKEKVTSIATSQNIEDALVEIIAAFDVYRTYINYDKHRKTDRDYIKKALTLAADTNTQLEKTIDFIGQYLLLEFQDLTEQPNKNLLLHFIMKFQQLTGPAMAKGLEDTVLYNYNRLISLNEVGSQPDCFGISIEKFHKFNRDRNKQCQLSLNTTSTHDTKRGEDVRARINVLSEIPDLWNSKVTYWKRINEHKKINCNGAAAPDVNEEYFLYQTLIGALPFSETEYETFKRRIKEYFIKVLREAKTHTTWTEQDKDYENACTQFVDKLLVFSGRDEFWQDFITFQKKMAAYAVYNSLSQVLIKMTAPGIPDFYQGSELWDLNLVDPDNRRPVNFEKTAWLLEEIKTKEKQAHPDFLTDLLIRAGDGRVKLFLIYKVLAARRKYKLTFEKGDYLPITVTGTLKKHIIAFARQSERDTVTVVASRFLTSIISPSQLPVGNNPWKDTSIIIQEPASWFNVITGEKIKNSNELSVSQIFHKFPVALLVSKK